MFTGQHGVTAGLQAGGAGEVHQQRQGLPGHPVLAVVDIEVADGQRQLGAPGRIVIEELTQMAVLDLPEVLLQGLPGRRGGDICAHSPDPSARRPATV